VSSTERKGDPSEHTAAPVTRGRSADDHYRWAALTNTTAAIFMAALDGSIVLISLPAIFRGIRLDPLATGNLGYLLWMIMGYRLVQAVLVVPLGRLGDMFGRVRIYNAGFTVFTAASILLSFDPFHGGGGALWLSCSASAPSPPATSPASPAVCPRAACSSCSSSGCRASGFRCTATTTPTRRCGPASTCCR
jgi:MFS family permease